ncbi:unnamed protein product [Adineta ricciae]|uniref:NAD(P)(+)--arginine ADP-ribosyltransferase n=1 Tax=Adineta ricciae TaxID=249248 RepID=A0A815QVU7_ADIRI|nr:unnamed protein product [Adineta ricciae]
MLSIRSDRFLNAIPGVTDEQFKHSQFLKFYNQTEKCPSSDSVIDGLIGLGIINDRSHAILTAIETEPDSYNIIKVYSSDFYLGSKKFYKYINEELMNDNEDTLGKLMPFIRRATSQINHHDIDRGGILYRGMNLNEEQRNFFSIGKLFRFPGFTTTTENIDVARRFGDTLFEIHVNAPCHQVVHMAHISYYKDEEEWLFSPYSRFQVKEIIEEFIILQSVDNLASIEDEYYVSDSEQSISYDCSISDTRSAEYPTSDTRNEFSDYEQRSYSQQTEDSYTRDDQRIDVYDSRDDISVRTSDSPLYVNQNTAFDEDFEYANNDNRNQNYFSNYIDNNFEGDDVTYDGRSFEQTVSIGNDGISTDDSQYSSLTSLSYSLNCMRMISNCFCCFLCMPRSTLPSSQTSSSSTHSDTSVSSF